MIEIEGGSAKSHCMLNVGIGLRVCTYHNTEYVTESTYVLLTIEIYSGANIPLLCTERFNEQTDSTHMHRTVTSVTLKLISSLLMP
jgi:hypothetical protein